MSQPVIDPALQGGADDDPDTLSTVTIGVVGTILLIAIVVALQGLYDHAQQIEFAQKVEREAPQELTDLRAKQTETLNGYRWIDAKAGVAGIPIDRAMELVIEERKGRAAAKP